jgi:hypothetical protein
VKLSEEFGLLQIGHPQCLNHPRERTGTVVLLDQVLHLSARERRISSIEFKRERVQESSRERETES